MSRNAGRLASISDRKRIEAANASARGEPSEWWVRYWPESLPPPAGWKFSAHATRSDGLIGQVTTHHQTRGYVLIEPEAPLVKQTARLRKAGRGRRVPA